ncbi:MAG: DUF4214 domain-containing protein [bacterium]
MADPPDNNVSDITSYILGQKSFMAIMPVGQTYTINLRSGANPMILEVTQGTDTVTTRAIRYHDFAVPSGVNLRLQITSQGIDALRYDADGDGTFESTVAPAASVTGPPAQDNNPPSVEINATTQANSSLVTITSSDVGSGVKATYFSLNGTNFQPYTSPFTVNPYEAPVVYAFADDNVANRSGLVTYYPSITPNQLDNAQFFVKQHYLDFLNRQPDASGLAFWTNEITSCGGNASCIEVKRINVSAAFYLSIEFQETGYLVERIYKASYGDAMGTSTFGRTHQLAVPIMRLNEFLPDTQHIGKGVVVNQPGWETVLENNKQAFTAGFVQRTRFTTAFPTTLTPAQFVDMLFANAGVTPSATDRNAAIGEFGAATDTTDTAARGRALRRVAENSTLNQQEFNRAFVLMQYFGYLRRNPNDPQDTDYTGYDFWLTKLNQFNGNFVNADMVKAFIVSAEYRQRFGP